MKNLLLFSTLLLTSSGVFAQLSVKPNGAVDSYVYVTDQILYVENDIHLERNSDDNDTEASIYLRNNGQLIQGNDTAQNSGDGQLSVQQNSPETNAWAYYYWCSPIGNAGLTGNPPPAGNRNFGVMHLYDPSDTSPTAATQVQTTTSRDGLNTDPITVSTRWLYTHRYPGTEAEGNYQRMNGGNMAPAGYGFTMKGVGLVTSGHDQTYDFRGRPNNGEFTIPVDEDLMTLSGNPYPSALDLNKLFYDADNDALGTFWYYDEDRTVASHYYSQKPYGYGIYTVGDKDTDGDPNNGNNLGEYAEAAFYIWNAGGSHGGTSQGTGTADQNKRFAPIGQGIMFVGAEGVGTENFVKIKNEHRVFFKEDTPGSVFQRPVANPSDDTTLGGREASAEAEPEDLGYSKMRIYAIFDEAVTRDMLLIFSDQATDFYDRGMDGLSPMGLNNDAYFPVGPDNDRRPYVINSVNYVGNKQVPIAFKLNKQTNILLRLVEEVNKPYEHAYLYDRQENTYQEMSTAMAAAPMLNLPAGTYDNRFFIVFRNPNLRRDIPQSEIQAMNAVQASINFFQNNPIHQLEISNPEGYTIKSASVYDLTGKLVIQEVNLGDKTEFSIYTGNLSNGVYLVNLITEADIDVNYKVIVQN